MDIEFSARPSPEIQVADSCLGLRIPFQHSSPGWLLAVRYPCRGLKAGENMVRYSQTLNPVNVGWVWPVVLQVSIPRPICSQPRVDEGQNVIDQINQFLFPVNSRTYLTAPKLHVRMLSLYRPLGHSFSIRASRGSELGQNTDQSRPLQPQPITVAGIANARTLYQGHGIFTNDRSQYPPAGELSSTISPLRSPRSQLHGPSIARSTAGFSQRGARIGSSTSKTTTILPQLGCCAPRCIELGPGPEPGRRHRQMRSSGIPPRGLQASPESVRGDINSQCCSGFMSPMHSLCSRSSRPN